MTQEDNNFIEIKTDLKYIKRDISEIKTVIDNNKKQFVTQDQFTPVKNIVYGLVSTTLMAVIGALLALIIK